NISAEAKTILSSNYPVICARFQDHPIRNRKFIFGDLVWDKPQDYVDLARICAEGGLEPNGLLAVMFGSVGWIPIAAAMSGYLNPRCDIVLHCPGNSMFVPVVRLNANHRTVVLFHRKDAT